MLNDLRHAVRVLLAAKGWTAVVVVSLALGIGANTALFSSVNGLFLRKLPVSEPDTLVRLRFAGRNAMATNSSDYGFSAPGDDGQQVRATFSYPMFQQFLADSRTMSDLVACAPYGRVNVVVDGRAEPAAAFIASGNFFRVLGVTTRLGRTVLPEDDAATAPPVAVISHRFWRSRFAGDQAVVGKVVSVNGTPVTVVGVLQPEFTGVQRAVSDPPDITVPLSLDPQLSAGQRRLSQPTVWWLQILGRLKPGATAEQVEANLGTIFQATARAGFDSYLASLSAEARSRSANQNRTAVPRLRVDSGSRGVYDVNRTDVRAVTILGAVVVLVLLIVCANVANLLLSRATTRQKELSVKLSLGASRARLVRQLLTESLLLASIGGAAGIVVGYWGHQLLPGATGQGTALDWRVLSFVLAVTSLTGIAFGIAPALRATGTNASAALKEQSRSVAASGTVLSKSLLIVQVAISLVLLIGAGLFLRTLQNLRQVDVGFDPHNLVVFRVNPVLNRYDDAKIPLLYESIMDRLRTVPGVRGVALSHMPLLSGGVNSTSLFVEGRTYAPGENHDIHRLVVSPDFFETMGMPLVAGRGFGAADHEAAPKVAVINEAAARKYLANENPVGRRFGTSAETSREFEIVGVLRDAKYDSVRDAAPPTLYVSFRQNRTPSAVFEVRTAADPRGVVGGLREAIREIDPTLPMMDVSTQAEQIEQRLLQERVFARAYSLFGALATILAAIGLFGVMSYSVARRTNEIGVRMALGAEARHVMRMVMRESMGLVAIGLVIGLAAAAAAGRLLASQLFGLAPTDTATMAAGTMVMLAVAAVAAQLPARRASRVDPIVALRCE
jgi:predicted permease